MPIMSAFLRSLTVSRTLFPARHVSTSQTSPSLRLRSRRIPYVCQSRGSLSSQASPQENITLPTSSLCRPDHPDLISATVRQAAEWAIPTKGLASSLSANPQTVAFLMAFVDRVMRPDHSPTAARMLHHLRQSIPLPTVLKPLDTFLLSLGSTLGVYLPNIVIPFARWRMLSFVSAFISSLQSLRFDGAVGRNVNLLGEAVLGEKEASRRIEEAIRLLRTPNIDYVSVKVSGVVSQLNPWDFEGSLDRVLRALRILFREAAASNPRVLINLDMEEYRDLEMTLAAFTTVLSEPEFQDLDAGIVLQTYLPDALPALQKLVSWAHSRPGTSEIKIRLVKGANLAMEKVDAVMHGWKQAPYVEKADTDANYLRCLSWVLTPERTERVRVGVASHNLFLLAYAHLLAEQRGVSKRVGFEMLQGMAPTHTPFLSKQGHGMLLYTPVCAPKDFDVAISYLFRRFEETTADGNFMRSMAEMSPSSPAFKLEEKRFRDAAERITKVSTGPRRKQPRPAPACEMSKRVKEGDNRFANEPDTDPALSTNREWGKSLFDISKFTPVSPIRTVSTSDEMSAVLNAANAAVLEWRKARSTVEREALFLSIADELARRRGDLINAMVFEGHKTIGEADPEVSEAIDFATYYGSQGSLLPNGFTELGVVCVTSPWNFPVAIPCGGVLAALAAGNAVILKPSSSTPRCAEIIAECLWAAGVPTDVLQFVQCPGNIGKKLITESDGVILTGSLETASLFRSWRKDMRLFAETSGKNSLVISQAADIDLAVADLVQSAFSNSGQRCSASSLAICIGDVYTSDRFLQQLEDAVKTLKVGPATDISSVMGPLIKKPDAKLLRALTELGEGEKWLVKPRCLDIDGAGRLWTPGVRLGVKPDSWFHQTEVFGPVLGVMQAKDLTDALSLQNGTSYGLTGGIHSLDPEEIEQWADAVEVGNAYVNRPITGAIVQRQSFGGWKGSVVGPGAKAGGPNYVLQFGTIQVADDEKPDEAWLERALVSDEKAWRNHFSKEHDLSGLFCEKNVLRYRSIPHIAIRVPKSVDPVVLERIRAAVDRCGVPSVIWSQNESVEEFIEKLENSDASRVRVVGNAEPEVLDYAAGAKIHVSSDPVVCDGRYEMLHYLREQSISKTLHRFGNMVGAS